MIISKKDVGSTLNKACTHDADNDGIHLARVANIVRTDMFKMMNQFNCSFESKCLEESVPVSILALVAMVLNGPNIVAQSSSTTIPQSVLTISQLLMFNNMVRHRKDVTSITRHSKERETPMPIYWKVMINSKTRKRELVDDLFELGISVFYNRVLEISANLGNNVCQQYMRAKAVCPPKLKYGLFTTAFTIQSAFSKRYITKKLQLKSLKQDCSLFSWLYIASQIRNGDLDEFFKYENQLYPPSLL